MKKVVYRDDIVEYQEFFSKEECKNLIEHFNSSAELWDDTCFYNAAVMFPLAPENSPHQHLNHDYFENLKSTLANLSKDVFDKDVRNLTLSAHKWNVGAYARDHADNAELDGTPNAWQENKFVTIIYLNEDYEGGQLYFRDHDLYISPKEGSVVVFDVGINNVHGVTEVTSGERYTMLLSWDFIDSVYPEDFYIQRDLEKKLLEEGRDKQREEWAKGNKFA